MIGKAFVISALAVNLAAGSLYGTLQKRQAISYPTQCNSACGSANTTLATCTMPSCLCTASVQTSIVKCLECSIQYGGLANEGANVQADRSIIQQLEATCASDSLSLPVATITSFSTLPSVASSTSASSSASNATVAAGSTSTSTTVVSTTTTTSATGGGFSSTPVTTTTTSASAAATTTTSAGMRMEPAVMTALAICGAVMGVFLMA